MPYAKLFLIWWCSSGLSREVCGIDTFRQNYVWNISYIILTIMISDEMSVSYQEYRGLLHPTKHCRLCLLFLVVTTHVRSLPFLQFHAHFWNIVFSSIRLQVILCTLILIFIIVYAVGFFFIIIILFLSSSQYIYLQKKLWWKYIAFFFLYIHPYFRMMFTLKYPFSCFYFVHQIHLLSSKWKSDLSTSLSSYVILSKHPSTFFFF